eukprot:768130-Hanusia_phi.AAC.1
MRPPGPALIGRELRDSLEVRREKPGIRSRPGQAARPPRAQSPRLLGHRNGDITIRLISEC